MKLSDVLIDIGKPVAFYPGLRKITKSTTATLFLCQFIYWSGKEANGDGWIYKTSDEIEEETGLTYEEQKTARKYLIREGLIEEKYRRDIHKMYFRVLFDEIDTKWGMPHSGTNQPIDPEQDDDQFPNEPMPHSRTSQSPIPEQGDATFGNKAMPHSLTTESTSEITQAESFEKKSATHNNYEKLKNGGRLNEEEKSAAFTELLINGSKNTGDKAIQQYPPQYREILQQFSDLFNLDPPRKGERDFKVWISGADAFIKACNGRDPYKTMKAIYQEWYSKGRAFYVTSPHSLVSMARVKVPEQKQPHIIQAPEGWNGK